MRRPPWHAHNHHRLTPSAGQQPRSETGPTEAAVSPRRERWSLDFRCERTVAYGCRPGAIAFDFAAMMGLNWFDNVHFSFGLLFGGGLVYGNHTALRNFV